MSVLSGKSVLVTGATGRIGADLVPRLEELGATVVPLVLHGYPRAPRMVPWTAEAEPLPMFAPKDLRSLPRTDHVINLHWKVNRSLSFSDQVEHEVTGNVLAPSFFWEWIKDQGVKTMVNCSSIRVYSHRNRSPVSSASEPEPTTPYGVAKLFGERYFSALFDRSRTVVSHLRLGSVCSFGENPSQLVSRLASSAMDGERIVVNTGHAVNLLYIDDAVDVIINTALVGEARPYLAVAPPVSTDEIARIFQAVVGKNITAEYEDLSPGIADLEFESDLDSLRAPWGRETPLKLALEKIVAEFKAQPR